MKRRLGSRFRPVVLAAVSLAPVIFACSRFDASTDLATLDGGATEATAPPDGVAPDAPPVVTFMCPLPAGQCAFGAQTCCVFVDAGDVSGGCVDAPSPCPPGAYKRVSCDSSRPCREKVDAAAVSCCVVADTYSCVRGTCDIEVCRVVDDCPATSSRCAGVGQSGYSICASP
jgi:hypothetical protein